VDLERDKLVHPALIEFVALLDALQHVEEVVARAARPSCDTIMTPNGQCEERH